MSCVIHTHGGSLVYLGFNLCFQASAKYMTPNLGSDTSVSFGISTLLQSIRPQIWGRILWGSFIISKLLHSVWPQIWGRRPRFHLVFPNGHHRAIMNGRKVCSSCRLCVSTSVSKKALARKLYGRSRFFAGRRQIIGQVSYAISS